jgi:hypothetical protein
LTYKYSNPTLNTIYTAGSTTTSYNFDTTALTVSSTSPGSGETGVTYSNIVITFNKNLNTSATLNLSAISVVKGSTYAGGTPVAFSASYGTNATDLNLTINSYTLNTQYWINLGANTVVDPYGNPSVAYGPYTFTTTAVAAGDQIFTGISATNNSYNWICPAFINNVSVVAVGSGSSYESHGSCPTTIYGYSGSGGGLSYKNNIPVTPGVTYTITISSGSTGESSFTNNGIYLCAATPGWIETYFSNVNYYIPHRGLGGGTILGAANDGGGNGGLGATETLDTTKDNGGGGAGGYSGNGGNGANTISNSAATAAAVNSGAGGGGSNGYPGGGVSIYGKGPDGAVNSSNTNASFMIYGGGAAGATESSCVVNYYPSGPGAVRIVWSSAITRAFPSTNVSTSTS